MNSTEKKSLRRNWLLAQGINSLYLLLFGGAAVSAWVQMRTYERMAQSLIEQIGQVDPDNFNAGYAAFGHLAGGGSAALAAGMLHLVLVICGAYALLFLADAAAGYVLYAKLRQREPLGRLRTAVQVESAVKCGLAVLVILPGAALLAAGKWGLGLMALVPQVVVLVLVVLVLRGLPGDQTQPECKMESKW